MGTGQWIGDRAGAGALAHGFNGDADLTQDGAETDVRAEVVGGDGEADAPGEQGRGDPGEPAPVQGLPVAAVQEDGDGCALSGGEQVHDLTWAAPVGDFDRRMRRASGLGGLAPALHGGRVVGHEGAVVVLGFPVNDFWVDLA
ncbi:MAG: hypothetical protein Q8M90_10940 [Brevundimonas sp.]|nr:hypothetical protein [Brevundimonas sp.]